MMDHQTIEAESVIDRYVTGRLSPEESDLFEMHYLDCPRCIDDVEAAERLQQGLDQVVPQADRERPPQGSDQAPEQAPGQASGRAPTPGQLHQRKQQTDPPLPFPDSSPSSTPWIRYAAAAALLASLGAGLFFGRETSRLRQDLANARAELARYTAEPAQNTPGSQDSDLAELLESWKQPAANIPLALLTPLRGGRDVFSVQLPREGLWTALWIELGGDELPSYGASLRQPDGEAVWSQEGLRLNDLGALHILLPVDLLAPGPWELSIVGPPVPEPAPGSESPETTAPEIATFSLAVKELGQ